MDTQFIEMLIQYGIAGAALLMMYDISQNHLFDIRALLIEIRDILLKE